MSGIRAGDLLEISSGPYDANPWIYLVFRVNAGTLSVVNVHNDRHPFTDFETVAVGRILDEGSDTNEVRWRRFAF